MHPQYKHYVVSSSSLVFPLTCQMKTDIFGLTDAHCNLSSQSMTKMCRWGCEGKISEVSAQQHVTSMKTVGQGIGHTSAL